ncbi:isoprenyl transferase [Clostridia bacterium]|nr:isoprenyl transferase [Clostridia bacterium]
MDGNGRWAKKRALPHEMGHRAGVESLRAIIRECGKLGVEVLTVYGFSTENWSRPQEEVSALMSLMLKCFRDELDELHKSNVRIRVIGDLAGLPEAQRIEAQRDMRITERNTGLQLNLALNYGGRDELVRAAKSIAHDAANGKLAPDEIDETSFAARLDTAGQPDVDLLIRTSGEMRTSNFLPYQTAYAEFIVTDTLWPDFKETQLHDALESYWIRSRRFGGRTKETER